MYQPTGPAPAAAALLAACPPAAAFTWTVHPTGALRVEHIAERLVSGELVALAACVGGTPCRTVLPRDNDRLPLGAVAVLPTPGRAAA
ncbi:hypothetical protein [Streptomyces sp. CA-253872]|uniref:hypothetical protein n=1 Tax=Streptomyces sp. CA-253872 TaxID=3240067 RepID=UPI003D8D96EE